MQNNNSTIVNIPHDLTDNEALRRTINRLVQELDKIKGYRGGVGLEDRLNEIIQKVAAIEARLDSLENAEQTNILRARLNLPNATNSSR